MAKYKEKTMEVVFLLAACLYPRCRIDLCILICKWCSSYEGNRLCRFPFGKRVETGK